MASKLIRRVVAVSAAGVVTFPTVGFLYMDDNNKKSGRTVQAKQLSIYENPEDKDVYEFVEEEASALKDGISVARKSISEMLDISNSTKDRMKEIFETSKAHTEMTISNFKEDPYGPSLTVLAALTAFVIGSRGGRYRLRGLIPGLFSGVAVWSLYYPNQAVDTSKSIYYAAKEKAMEVWESQTGSDSKTDETKQKKETESSSKS